MHASRPSTANPRGVFVSGTDTGIGKTLVSTTLLAALNAAGIRAVGMKPVASGCEDSAAGLRNDDALRLIARSATAPEYASVNPFAFRDPIAPHLAASDDGVETTLQPILAAFDELSSGADMVVVEGVGGWAVPLSASLTLADIPRALKLPVILVVGLRLGCLNHAILSARAIVADGCDLIGWIGNHVDPDMARVDDNIVTLRQRLHVPCLGVVPHAGAPQPGTLAIHLRDAVRAIASAACPAVP